ncbi:MAG: DUF4091 domain-containing protein [Ruminococcaceae bacterium]|nr:DUF4091 domain-containing protein [Oscillospiraceae bacterium]
MSVINTRLLSSLVKVFPEEAPEALPCSSSTALKGEVFTFQVAYSFPTRTCANLSVTVESALGDAVQVRSVECVPSMLPIYENHDDYLLRDKPCLFPDVLKPFENFYVHAANVWHSAWVTVELPEDCAAGVYPISVAFALAGQGEVARETFVLTVLDAVLPKQEMLYTAWFHVDGITGYYGVEAYSERCWELIESFMKVAASRGQNLILTPVFTPPLDTAVGGERPTVQLVDVTVTENGGYVFNFDKLRRWIALCRKTGIANLEISHLFTQWGAGHAPKIMATMEKTGSYERIFGWETDAAGEEYVGFLKAFLPQLDALLKEEGMNKNAYFHVSDEPGLAHLEQYKKVSGILSELLPDYPMMDALSNFDFYTTGAVETPIPASNHIEPFIEGGVKNLWTYYCCSQNIDVANRFMAFPSARNRVLGVQLYKFEIAGFLQWGYNFYNSCLSQTKINPFVTTDAGEAFPSGDAFVVYPGPDGAWSSIRLEVFHEALQDMRALKLAESLVGREKVMEIVEEGIEPITFKQYPHGDAWLLSLRERINALIAGAAK